MSVRACVVSRVLLSADAPKRFLIEAAGSATTVTQPIKPGGGDYAEHRLVDSSLVRVRITTLGPGVATQVVTTWSSSRFVTRISGAERAGPSEVCSTRLDGVLLLSGFFFI